MPDPKTISLLKRVAASRRAGSLPGSEAAILDDMIHAGKAQAALLVDFVTRYLPAPAPRPRRAAHGGLIASAAEIRAVRRRIERDPVSAAAWQALSTQCRTYMRPGLPGHIDWQQRDNPDLWQRRMGHWRLGRAVQDLAWAWAFSGEQPYAAHAEGILLTVAGIRQGWRPLGCNYGTPYHGWLNDNLLDLGHATLGFAIAYDLLRARLRPAERADVAAYFEPFLWRVLNHRYYGADKPGHNFAPIGFSGAGLLALALSDDVPASRRGVLSEVLAWAEAYAVFTLDTIAGSDGAPLEGSAYGSASMYYLTLFAEGLRRRCGRDLFSHATWRRFPRYLVMETLPGGGAFNNFNDNHYETHAGFWPLVARRTDDPAADWVWWHHQGPGGSDLRLTPNASLCELPLVLLGRHPRSDALDPRDFSVSPVHKFPDQQHLVVRTGWQAADLHVSFQCTRGRPGGHSQCDRLNFTMYALGERFVIDSGYGMKQIPGSSEVQRLGALAPSHNQVLIDGAGQVQSTAANAGRLVTWGRKADWVWALGDAAGAYEHIRLARRLLAVRRSAAAPCVVVADWLIPSRGEEHRFEWLLQTDPKNTLRRLGPAGHWDILGGRGGRSLRFLHMAIQPVSVTVDEWIDHPRLSAASGGRVFLALTVFGTGELSGDGVRTSRSIQWADGLGSGTARLQWHAGRTGRPSNARVTLAPLGVTVDLG